MPGHLQLTAQVGDPARTPEQIASWDGPPLILFVGVSTGGSVAHAVFDGRASVLGQPWRLAGADLSPGTPARTYQQLVAAMHRNPGVHGAVITAHKLRLYRGPGRPPRPRHPTSTTGAA